MPYFNGLGYPCPKHENPADFFIDLLTIDPSSEKTTQDSEQRVDDIIQSSKSKPHTHEHEKEPERSDDRELSQNNQTGAGFLKQIYLLVKRTTTNSLRDRAYLIGRTAQNLLLAVMVLILFFQMDNDQTSIQDRISVVFMCLLGTTFSEAVAAALVCSLSLCFMYSEF